ncbi:MAG: calcium-binding protein [Actinobacteria bacterium]|nr:MAG: calcium-binding protein [Actinomycetota bacterium]
MRSVLLAVAFLALPVPVCAAKATVAASVEFFDDYKVSDAVFTVSAVGDADDDTMQSTITRGEYGEPLAVFVDDTVGAIAAAGCEQVDATRVRCDALTPGPPADAEINLDGGPGNDHLYGGDGTALLAGGDGDDVLDGSQRHSGRLEGGPGADRLIGPAPSPHLPFGGPLADGGPGPDVITGNAVVTYADRTRPVRVDLRSSGPTQGERGEGDVISGPNAVIGGHGADTLIAGDSRAELMGGPGNDRLVGGPEGDELFGDAGADVLRGGAGDDELLAGTTRDGDTMHGGPGDDRFLPSPGPDVLAGDGGADTMTGVGRRDVVRARGGGPDEVACIAPPARVTVDRLDLVLGCPRARVFRRGSPRPRVTQIGSDDELDAPSAGRSARVAIGCPVDMPVPCVVQVRLRDQVGFAGSGRVVARPGFSVGGEILLTQRASHRARCSGRLRLGYAITYRAGDGTVLRLRRRHSEPVRRSTAC